MAAGDSILAFRTITTMLNDLQDGPTGGKPAAYLTNTGQSKARELRTLDATATLLVRHHEVISVASTTRWLGIDLVACATMTSSNHMATAVNPCKFNTKVPNDSLNYKGKAPCIIAPQVPVQIDLDDPLSYVRETWGAQTFQDHAAALGSLFTQYTSLSQKDTSGLLQYIVAKSFPIMLMRINNPRYSKPFMDALLVVPTINYYPTHVWTKLSHFDNGILDVVSNAATLCAIAIPNLQAMAENREGAQLYTADTCQEFHLLLCALLQAFQKCLVGLSQYNKLDSEASLRGLVVNALFFGEMLWMVAYSSGIDAHLQAISGDLKTNRVHPKDKDIVVEKGEEDAEEDIDLRGVQPNTIIIDGSMPKSLSTWEACRDWLRLLVAHFQALTILDRHFGHNNRPATIVIKVLAVPPVEEGSMMLTWQTLLKKYYKDTKPPFADIISTIETLQADEGYEPHVSPPPERLPSTFFKAKFGENSPLSRGSGFIGVDHCETCLASLMSKLGSIPSQFQGDYSTILKELSTYEPILGVSKRCCPVCSTLLSMLREANSRQSFIVRGAHATVYPCSLPSWLPREIVDRMVHIFWEKLKERLVDLCYSTERMRERAQSTGSERSCPSPNEEPRRPPRMVGNRLITAMLPPPPWK